MPAEVSVSARGWSPGGQQSAAVRVAPTTTTAVSGDHRERRLWTVTVIGAPVPGSVEWMVTGRCSIADMPRASIAHIAYTDAPASMSTTCAVGRAENGYAARIAPDGSRRITS